MASIMCRFVIVFYAFLIGVYCDSTSEGGSQVELVEDVQSSRDSERDARAMDHEKWRALEYQNPENQDWIPADGLSQSSFLSGEDEPPLKRRRPGRKRKRRPQNPDREYQNDEDPYSDRIRPRLRRPQRLDQRRDQWRDEMMSEEPFRPIRNYNRRRLYPKYDEESSQTEGEKDSDRGEENFETRPVQTSEDQYKIEPVVEKIRDPYTALNQEQGSRRRPYSKRKYNRHPGESDENKEQTTDRVDVASPLNLKTLLKQNGGISLSELLQQKNLSLADLLKGERHAISALTEVPEPTADITPHSILEDDQSHKRLNYNRRLPPNRKIPKPEEDENEYTTIRTNLSPQKKRTSLFNNYKDTKYSEPVTEPVTERRIFVPSHPKYYTSVDYKPSIKTYKNDKTTESIITTPAPEKTSESISIVSSTVTFSTSENPTTVKAIKKLHRTLPPTLAKLKSISTKTTMKSIVNTERENYPILPAVPVKAIKINVNELYGMNQLFNSTSPTTEGPMKISVNIEQQLKTTENEDDKENLVLTENLDNEESSQTETFFTAQETEKLKQLSAKDEIMEVLTDSMSRENLTKLLEARNMTLDELVEQRERGSSQRHLADIFHNQTKEPEPPEEMVVDDIIKPNTEFYDSPSLFDAFPVFEDQPYNSLQIKPSEQTKYYTSVVELPTKTRESRQNQFSATESDDYNYVNNPIFKTPTEKSHDIINKYMPIWRQAYTNLHRDKQDKANENDLVINDEAHRIEEIENKLAEAVNDALNVELVSHKSYTNNYEEENEFFRLPYGVRSAIIASGIIIGLSIIIFLTIFIIFKLAQKKRERLAYCNSFSNSKIKSPILEQQYQSRLFGSIMNATLGRNKKVSTISSSEPQSLQEYLWENDRKPFQ